MDVQPILPVKVCITIGTMLNFDGDFDGHGDGNVTCKQTFNPETIYKTVTRSYLQVAVKLSGS